MSDDFPFQPTDNRQYVCFVCGIAFVDYSEYRSHIVDNHDEGREYILCPLQRCKAPIRDVRLHFKVKHPSEKMPENCQMRATIWSDQRSPKKKKKPRFKAGWVESAKNGKQMHYRSGYEKDVYECLERLPEVVGYAVEKCRIEYQHNGRTKNYYPDLLIQFQDGHFEIWEIKPSNQTTYAVNKSKWAACQAHCAARGWTFMVMTEYGIKDLKKKVMLNEDKRQEG